MIEEVDLSDPSQAEAARDAVGEMLKPADDSLSPIPTRPPTKKEKKRREKQQQTSASGSNEPNATNIYTPEGKNAFFTFGEAGRSMDEMKVAAQFSSKRVSYIIAIAIFSFIDIYYVFMCVSIPKDFIFLQVRVPRLENWR